MATVTNVGMLPGVLHGLALAARHGVRGARRPSGRGVVVEVVETRKTVEEYVKSSGQQAQADYGVLGTLLVVA